MAQARNRRKRYSITISTGVKELQANHVNLFQPKLTEIIESLKKKLSTNYKEIEIIVKKCPDLSEWGNLADKGICGHGRLAEVGGLPYLYSKKHQSSVAYQIPDIVKAAGRNEALVFGAGVTSYSVMGQNGTLIPNTKIPGPRHTRYICMQLPPKNNNSNNNNEEKKNNDNNNSNNNNNNNEEKKEKQPSLQFYPSEEVGCCSNLYLCDGKMNEDVIYIKVKQRIGTLSFTNCIRDGLKNVKGCDKNQQIGIGGIIKVLSGKVSGYIMSDYLECDYKDKKTIDTKAVKKYDFGPNLIMFSSIITDDPTNDKSFHLTLENTNFYTLEKQTLQTPNNEGGHYINDVTPDTIEYEAYFNVAQYIYRIEDAWYNLNIK